MPLSVGDLARGSRTFTVDYSRDDGSVEPFSITYRPGLYTAEWEEKQLLDGLEEIIVSWSLVKGGTGKGADEPHPTTKAGLTKLPLPFLYWVANVLSEDVRADPTRRAASRDTGEPGA